MKKWYIAGSVVLAASLVWFVYNVFFIQEGDVIYVSESPTGHYKVFLSQKDSFFSNQPKYVAAFVEMGEQPKQAGREIFYYSPDAIEADEAVFWKNRDTVIIAGHELRLPLDRYHYLIR